MDNSRANQLARFRSEMTDFRLPWATRARAGRAFYRVKRQLKDRVLARLRYQYMRADAAGDNKAREALADRLETYMFKTYKRRI